MVEILWKTDEPHAPLTDQEFYELRLVDLGSVVRPRFLVREIHAAWSALEQQIKWDGYEDDMCHTPEQAQRCFQTRRESIVSEGFIYSNILHGGFPSPKWG